jgi:hypothetical protein
MRVINRVKQNFSRAVLLEVVIIVVTENVVK